MKEIKDHTGGPTSDRQAWFQFIHEDDMVAEKSVHTIREDKIFPGRIYEIQQAVTCTLTKMWIDLNKILEKNLGNEIVPRTVFKKESDAHIILDVFFDSQPVPCTFTQADKYVNRAEDPEVSDWQLADPQGNARKDPLRYRHREASNIVHSNAQDNYIMVKK